MKTLPMLMRRELWEHRALWIAPLVVPVLAVAAALTGHLSLDVSAGAKQLSMSALQFVVLMFLVFFYLLDCLFTERRERSILFWKSLPVSDTATVLSKFLLGVVLVPVGVYFIAMASNLLFVGITELRGSMDMDAAGWDIQTWFKVQSVMLISLVAAILWYVPIAGYLLVISAWARRAPFLWAILPPIMLIILERIVFGTSYVGRFIGYRFTGWIELLGPAGQHVERGSRRVAFESLLDSIHMSELFTNVNLWLGLLAGAALVYAAIRVRGVKDDA